MDNIVCKIFLTIKGEGFYGLLYKGQRCIKRKFHQLKSRNYGICKDVLFIDGCGEVLLHPSRYRVVHQMEQLRMNNMSCDSVYIEDLSPELVFQYRIFVIFRCPCNVKLEEFVWRIHQQNKKVLYDIDDLVIDTVYTDQIAYLDTFSQEERRLYDENVMSMGKMLQMCDGAITSTERLQEELIKYVPDVFINRNSASEQMVELSDNTIKKTLNTNVVKIGYFSGSITHNDDFEWLFPELEFLLRKYDNLQLHIAGILSMPESAVQFENRIVFHTFVDWKKLPELISSVDINIVPLQDTIFNQAKSENKWIEASLVKVPTVASNVGAFSKMIQHESTGLLCKSEKDWIENLSALIESTRLREELGEKAYDFCIKNCTTLYTGNPLKCFLQSKASLSIGFVVPGLSVSGGMRVILKHVCVLKEAGVEVSLIVEEAVDDYCEFEGICIPVLRREKLNRFFDKLVATMWTTVKFVEEYVNVNERYYLVQNFETEFYEVGNRYRIEANATYSPKNNVKFITISKWCQDWLLEKYSQDAKYAPNGIDDEFVSPVLREFEGKIRILVEGDNSVYYKNVDESFKITNKLDPEKYEIWYMSYNALPKKWYRVDRFFHKIAYEEVKQVYQQCHILLKTSILESFSYPPLEMMATGGYVVALPNAGNKEYLRDGFNCLFYERGSIQQAIELIYRLSSDCELRAKLYKGGLKTAELRKWDVIKRDIIKLYM